MSVDWTRLDKWIAGEAWVGSRLDEYLAELCTRIGPRWDGTPGDIEAARYIRGQMEHLGLTDARLEEFELDSWDHGLCEAWIVQDDRTVDVLPMLNCPPIEYEGPIVDVGFGMGHELDYVRDRLPSSVAVVNLAHEPFSPQRPLPDRLIDIAEAGAAVAVVVEQRSGGRIEYERATDKRRAERAGQILPQPLPSIQTTREGGALLRLAASQNESLRAKVESRSFVTPCFNTVAEIPGTEWPEETLIIGAHHDTYPGSPGAVDNGSGTVVVMDVARVLSLLTAEAGVSPGRTIKFCTWSGEEQNHQGSAAYVRQHHGPEPHPKLVVNLDEVAAGPIKGLVLQFDYLRPLVQRVLDEIGDGLKCHVHAVLEHTNDGFSFARSAIPYATAWRWRFVGRHPDSDYRAEASDTADKVRVRELKEYVAMLARVLLRLSHVPPSEWPDNPETVEGVQARLDREIGTVGRTM